MEYRTLHIGRLFRGVGRGHDRYIYYVLTENGLLKYFISSPGIHSTFIAFIQIDTDNDEVIFVDDVKNLFISYIDGRTIASYKDNTIKCYDVLYYIKDSELSVKEANVFNYIKYNGMDFSRPIFTGLNNKYKEIVTFVESLDIDSIFNSYNVFHTIHCWTTRDDQDREEHEIRSVCEYDDAYIIRFLPKFDFRNRPSVILSQEDRNQWTKAMEILSKGIEQYKKEAKLQYDKIQHIEYLLSDYIYQEECSFLKDFKYQTLAEYADKEWCTPRAFWFCNNYKEDIRKHNQELQVFNGWSCSHPYRQIVNNHYWVESEKEISDFERVLLSNSSDALI